MERELLSELPNGIDWMELNDFFVSTHLLRKCSMLSDQWHDVLALNEVELSLKSVRVLECIHKDLSYFFHNILARKADGAEDRVQEYRMLKELLFDKYGGLSKTVLDSIYSDYLYRDR